MYSSHFSHASVEQETNGESGRRQVSSVTVASTAHTGILCWAVYEHVILHWGETSYLSESTWWARNFPSLVDGELTSRGKFIGLFLRISFSWS